MKIYIIWLIGIIMWNFGYPAAKPIEDVLAAIILSFISMGLKKYFLGQSGLPYFPYRGNHSNATFLIGVPLALSITRP